MRVCHVTFTAYPGAGAAAVYELTQVEAQSGLDVTAIVIGTDIDRIQEGDEGGVHVVRIPSPSTSARSPAKLGFIQKANAYLAQHDFDIVVVYSNIGMGLLPLLAGSRRSHAVWIHNIRSGPITGGVIGWIGKKLLWLESLAYDGVFILGAGTRRMVFGEGRQDALIVPAGANFTRFQRRHDPALRQRLGIAEATCMLVYAGFMHASRKTETLLEAMRELVLVRRHADICLVIIGVGPELERLQQLAADYQLESHVKFLGRVPFGDMPRYYSVADIGLGYVTNSPEYGPQPPLKTVEMLGCDLPVVATNTEGNRLFVVDRVNGLLVDDSAAGLAHGVEELLRSPALRAQLSSQARQSVAQFDFGYIATQVIMPEYQRLSEYKQRGQKQAKASSS